MSDKSQETNNADLLDGSVDMVVLANIKDVMGDKLPSLIRKYLLSSEKYIEQIENSLAANEAQSIADAAHPFKSSSSILGSMKVSKIAKEMEYIADDIVNNGGDFKMLASLTEQIKKEFEAAKIILEKEL